MSCISYLQMRASRAAAYGAAASKNSCDLENDGDISIFFQQKCLEVELLDLRIAVLLVLKQL